MIMKRLDLYNTILDYKIENETLYYSGVWKSDSRYINHSFFKGCFCLVKDKRNFKKKKAKILQVNKDNIVVLIDGNKTKKKIDIIEFIQTNYVLETLIRLEFEDKGIYSNTDKLPIEVQALLRSHQEEIRKGIRSNQPVPFNNGIISTEVYSELRKNWKFAFHSFEQLFKWFNVSEMSFLIKNGIKLRILQEFKDFEKYNGDAHQVIYTNTKDSNIYISDLFL